MAGRGGQSLPRAPAWCWALPALPPPGGRLCPPPSLLSKEAATKRPLSPILQSGRKAPGLRGGRSLEKSAGCGTRDPRQCLNGVPGASESHLPGDWATAGQVFYWRFTDTRAPSRVTAWRRRVEAGVSPRCWQAPAPPWEAPWSPSCGLSGLRGPGARAGAQAGSGQPLKAGVQRHKEKPRGPQERAGAGRQDAGQLEARRPLDGRSFRRPHCLAHSFGGPGRTPALPRPRLRCPPGPQ